MTTAAQRVADRVLVAMAYDRNTFKDKVEEHLGGALLEFYKARLAAKNGQTKWVQHWMTEVATLVDRNFVAVLLHSIRGFKDRGKAFKQVKKLLQDADAGYRGAAERVVLHDFKLKKLKQPLSDEDTAAFWARVHAAAIVGGIIEQGR